MKTNNIDESLGYAKAVTDTISIITEMVDRNGKVDALLLIHKLNIGCNYLSVEPKNKKPNLFSNPIYERNSQ